MKIDFVVPWVDGGDPVWLEEKRKHLLASGCDQWVEDSGEERYRDWGLLRYFFRGVAKNAPWVNSVYLVTCGHLPDWLNVENSRLRCVKHEDYIPEEWLPTFNSNAIELNLHRIQSLSEHFVLFNDDLLILDQVQEEDFFHKGLPCATAVLNAEGLSRGSNFYTAFNNACVLNDHFTPQTSVMRHPLKWFNPVYGLKQLRTALMLAYPTFKGFYEPHLCNSFKKSTFEEVWSVESLELENTSSHRFRTAFDVSNWLMKDWQCAKGDFYPRSASFGHAFNIGADDERTVTSVEAYLRGRKGKVVCLNDGPMPIEQFEEKRRRILACLDELFPEKCEFEL